MSGTEETYLYTKEDVRKLEARESKLHGGKTPADSEASQIKASTLPPPCRKLYKARVMLIINISLLRQ